MLRIANRGSLLILLCPVVIFFLLRQYAATRFYGDPTSSYFDFWKAYRRGYTKYRIEEALNFLAGHNSTDAPAFKRENQNVAPYICVGMNTIVRPSGDVYARASLGSLVAGLTQKERNQLFLMPMIGHINETDHPIFNEPWLEKISDRILTYSGSIEKGEMKEEQFKEIEELELTRQKTGVPDRQKHLGDYTHLLRVCAATKAPYVLMFEDDVLLLDGWFHRTRAALKEVGRREGGGNKWFYLRLFHTENALSWTGRSIIVYVVYSAVLFFGVLIAYPLGIRYMARSPTGQKLIQQHGRVFLPTVILTCVLGVTFFFSIGRLSIAPPTDPVLRMPHGGCCAQGMLYPNAKVGPLATWYDKNRIGFVDSLAERLANEKPDGIDMGSRYALNPVVLQHIGVKSSKGDNWGSDNPELSEAQRLWNFGYESNDPSKLAQEHKKAADALELERVQGSD